MLGMAHITGGGFVENLPRVLPRGLAAHVQTDAWRIPPLFAQLVEWAGMDRAEAFRVFNMGIGMVLIVPAAGAPQVMTVVEDAVDIGELQPHTDSAPQLVLA
jgi:phosphoribosylformylglycinamidine cyclo-ligase